jgi:Zn-dependent M28 family amino/carboxypeptidase
MVADVNMDMIGRNAPDSILAVGGGYSSLGATAMQMATVNEAISLTVVVNTATDRAFPGSDNLSFACRDVPALFLHSGLHDDYHRPSDEVARLDADKAARVARLALYVVDWTATADGVPTWTAAGRQALDASRLGCP